MIMTISCVLLILGCGAADRSTISMDQYQEVTALQDVSEDENPDASETRQDFQTDDKIYVVISIDTENRLIGLGLPDSARTVQYGYTKTTRILDDHGQFMSAARLVPTAIRKKFSRASTPPRAALYATRPENRCSRA